MPKIDLYHLIEMEPMRQLGTPNFYVNKNEIVIIAGEFGGACDVGYSD